MFTTKYYDTHSFGFSPELYTGAHYLSTSNYETYPVEINVAGWEKDEIEVTQDGPTVVITAGNQETKSFRKEVCVGNSKVSKATYKAGMLTLHFEDTSSVIPIE